VQEDDVMPSADWKRICCPIDFSDASRAAMEVAADLARRFGAELVLLHAYPIPGYTFPDGSVVASPKMMQDLADQAQKHLEEWRVEAEKLVGAPRVSGEKAVGEPAAEILETAREARADLIVMGTHGRTGLEHALMGSIAERVVRRAHCPVLTVRPSGK
jgi:nucleotide-binding universal stress UspA family protein